MADGGGGKDLGGGCWNWVNSERGRTIVSIWLWGGVFMGFFFFFFKKKKKKKKKKKTPLQSLIILK